MPIKPAFLTSFDAYLKGVIHTIIKHLFVYLCFIISIKTSHACIHLIDKAKASTGVWLLLLF